jgi:hypothetical protein
VGEVFKDGRVDGEVELGETAQRALECWVPRGGQQFGRRRRCVLSVALCRLASALSSRFALARILLLLTYAQRTTPLNEPTPTTLRAWMEGGRYGKQLGRIVQVGSRRYVGRYLIAEIGHGQEITNI